jgi:demethylmenaquinone methyltransferase / 2-methoxy-6-polyprenyl-1,4-benzoquinol methylase
MATEIDERIWLNEGERKRKAVREMFSEIAPRYDFLNSLMSFSLHRRWRAYAVSQLHLRPGDTALDVCCGTGDFLLEAKKIVGGKAFGIDFCRPMLDRAANKVSAPLGVGDACSLPVQDSSVNAVTVGWGIRNVPDIDAAHREIARVLKPGGRFVSLDMARPRNGIMRAICGFMFKSVVPRVGAIFGASKAYTYLPRSTEMFWSREDLCASMERAGLTEVTFKDLFFGNICAHFGRKPIL